jgi:hypothetical protein
LASASTESLQRRLRVLVAAPGKQLFSVLGDPRVRVYPAEADAPAPDLVVYPCSQQPMLERLPPGLPAAALERVRSGKARVVFDASGEGHPHTPALAAALHGRLEQLGAPSERAVYITQDRTWEAAYLDHCRSAGVSRPMSVLVYDYWIKRFFAALESDGPRLYDKRLRAFRARPQARKKRFLSLNWTARPAKVFLLLRLMKDGLWDRGYISFGGFEQLGAAGKGGLPQVNKAMRGLDGFDDLYAELLPWLKRLDRKGQVRLGEPAAADPEGGLQLAGDAALAEYGQSWFSVVAESEMSGRPVRITEKPFKPLVNFHPLLVLGNPGALRMIRALGFETFPEMFDESWDDEPDPRRRFDLAYAELARLCRMDEAELARLEAAIVDKLARNARFGLTELPRRYRESIDAALIDQLAGGRLPALQP